MAPSLALHSLLESTTTLKRFELLLWSEIDTTAFQLIAQGLTNSISVTEVAFVGCTITEESDANALGKSVQDESPVSFFEGLSISDPTAICQFALSILDASISGTY